MTKQNCWIMKIDDENQLSFSLECNKQMALRKYVNQHGKKLSPSENTMGFNDAGEMAFISEGYKVVKCPSTVDETETWLIRVTCESNRIAIAFGQRTNSKHALIDQDFSYGKSTKPNSGISKAQECFMECLNFVEFLEKHNRTNRWLESKKQS